MLAGGCTSPIAGMLATGACGSGSAVAGLLVAMLGEDQRLRFRRDVERLGDRECIRVRRDRDQRGLDQFALAIDDALDLLAARTMFERLETYRDRFQNVGLDQLANFIDAWRRSLRCEHKLAAQRFALDANVAPFSYWKIGVVIPEGDGVFCEIGVTPATRLDNVSKPIRSRVRQD